MLTLLSPAKKLLKYSMSYECETTQPQFIQYTHELAALMQSKSINEIAELMDLSDELALLNFNRYQNFKYNNLTPEHSYPALFFFQGDVYQGLQALSWDKKTIEFSQDHLGILSGLYGLLKPLDRIQPYRLEMGVRLLNSHGKNLYDFWRETITTALNSQLSLHKNPILINLASSEYSRAIDENGLDYPMVTINFYEKKNNVIKMIGIYAKKARGVMAKFLMENQIDNLDGLKTFKELGYQYIENSTSNNHIDFIRIN